MMISVPEGNLIKNHGFEIGLALWQVPLTLTSTVTQNVRIADAGLSHSGLAMLGLGGLYPKQPAMVFQEVQVSPGKYFELDFSVAGFCLCPAPLQAAVTWLDGYGNEIGLGLSIFIPATTIGQVAEGGWTLHTGVTDESPVGTRIARISFTRGSGLAEVFIDDVFFFQVG
ncbi:MAG TPA: hypothetical protein GX524_08345 [Firmicutes bacterium]|nr:hypothetical protein [Bacillota bacterium]